MNESEFKKIAVEKIKEIMGSIQYGKMLMADEMVMNLLIRIFLEGSIYGMEEFKKIDSK